MRSPIAGILGAVGGVTTGWLLDRATLRPTAAEQDPPECPRCPTDPEPCRAPIDQALAELRARDERLYGNAVPFPDDLPPEFGPDQLRANLERAVAACGLALELIDIDCGEYPCLMVLGTGEGETDLQSCPSWKEQYPRGHYVSRASILTPEGERGWQLTGPWGPGPALGRIYSRRLDHRREHARRELMVRWGAREPTPAEQRDREIDKLEQQIEWWRERGESGETPPDQVSVLIQGIERELEELQP